MWYCKHCGNNFDFLETHQKANHSRWCNKNPNRSKYLESSKAAVDAMNKRKKELGISNQFDKAKKEGISISHKLKGKKAPQMSHLHTDETRRKMSESRKLFLKKNPDKHPWKKSEKFRSNPCEHFKNQLRKNNIEFNEEWMPLFPERYFSIDIAFPDKKIGIEINGNQHYNRDGTLKKYYKERHDIIEDAGWQLIELHYLEAYNEKIIENIKTNTSSYSSIVQRIE